MEGKEIEGEGGRKESKREDEGEVKEMVWERGTEGGRDGGQQQQPLPQVSLT